MEKDKKVKCPWCEKETSPDVSKEKSDYTDIVVRRCSECKAVIASYIDESRTLLEKVRTFKN
ncbi:MAG: hypothetical protein AUJ48_02400 [Deltaproteobacteria bacterium CG1_02_45_11]|nr:MAG: hypothetical protein AUJ48_02400 [Deltaproteobacteria bacterium CG1_02_45_11]